MTLTLMCVLVVANLAICGYGGCSRLITFIEHNSWSCSAPLPVYLSSRMVDRPHVSGYVSRPVVPTVIVVVMIALEISVASGQLVSWLDLIGKA